MPVARLDCRIAGQPVPVRSLIIRRAVAWPVGTCRIALPAGIAMPACGDAVAVADAAGNELFTGTVERTAPAHDGGWFQAAEPTAALARLRLDRAWASTTADQVVADLCDAAGVTCERPLMPGATLPAYTSWREVPALDQVLRLARLSGMVACTAGDGALHLGPAALVPGGVIIDQSQAVLRSIAGGATVAEGVRIIGSGALGTGGPGAETWIVEDTSSISAGPDDAAACITEPVLAVRADVERMQQSEDLRRRVEAQPLTLVLGGVPGLDLNHAFTVIAGGTTVARCTGLAVALAPTGLTTTVAAVPLAA